MLKKLLLTVIAILIAGVAMMLYGTYRAADEFVEKNEPQLRQYAQMDEAAQDQFVLENADNILTQAQANPEVDAEVKADANLLRLIKDDPAVQRALTELGRAIMAAAILHSEEIAHDLNDKLKADFEREKSQLTDRLKNYGEAFAAAEAKLKGEQ